MLYRTRSSHALACLFGAVPFLVIGLGGIVLMARERAEFAGRDGWALAFLCGIAGTGLFGILAGFDLVFRQIAIDADGFVRRSLFGLRCVKFAWTEVDSWLTWPVKDTRPVPESANLFMKADRLVRPTPLGRAIVFRFRGKRPPLFVPEQEVSLPSFERFLADVRREVGVREIQAGNSASTTPERAVVDAIQLPVATAIEPASRRDR
jgi:hypothetical protein